MMEEINPRDLQNKHMDSEDVYYDKLLASAGELGRYQSLLFISIFPFYFFGTCVYFSQLFMTVVPPEHWCWIPELENLTQEDRRNLAIPKNDNNKFGFSNCNTFDANWTVVLESGFVPNNTRTVTCHSGWEFDRTTIPYPTISSDFEWVCEKKSYQATAQTIFFAGSVVGGILIGWMADRFGRVSATIASNLLGCIGGLTSTYATTLAQFAVCRFIMGMAFDTCMMIPYLILLEYTAPRYRSVLANTSFAVFFSLFASSYPFVALACGHWKKLSLVSSVPLGLAVLTPLVLPESPRWLLSKNRIGEVISKIQVIGRINRKPLSKEIIKQFKETFHRDLKEDRVNLYEIFKVPVLRKNMIIVCLVYMTCQTIFDCLFRNLEQLQFDFFLSFAASSATELPSMLICAFVIDILGRRLLTVSMLAINCVVCVLIVFVKTGVQSLVCAVIARFVINIATSTTLQWSAEMLPTSVRGSGVSFVIICGNLAILMSPYITFLKVYIVWLPFIVMATLAAIGAVIAFMLPETAKREIPHTFDDAESLAKDQNLWQIYFLTKDLKEEEGQVNLGYSQ